MTDLNIKLDLSRITLHPELEPTVDILGGCGNLLGSEDVDCWLRCQHNLQGWTYSLNPRYLFVYEFKRLIVGVHQPDLTYSGIKTDIRYARNTHVKAYFTKKEALIGSHNLTAPTISDLCVLVRNKAEVKWLQAQFNRQWKLLA